MLPDSSVFSSSVAAINLPESTVLVELHCPDLGSSFLEPEPTSPYIGVRTLAKPNAILRIRVPSEAHKSLVKAVAGLPPSSPIVGQRQYSWTTSYE